MNIEVKHFLRVEDNMQQYIQLAEEDNYFMECAQKLMEKTDDIKQQLPSKPMKNGNSSS